MSYQPEERYWTDYLRIAFPVAGLLILIALLWYWATALIGQPGGDVPVTPSAIAGITPINVAAAPASPTAAAAVIQVTPGLPVAVTPTVAAVVVATQPPAPTEAVPPTTPPQDAGADQPERCANRPVYEPGSRVRTTEALNLRDAPVDGAVLEQMPRGTELEITGDFSEQGECDWWPVTVVSSGEAGFAIEEFLEPVS